MIYYLSLGSNLQPELNAVNMLRALLQHFGPLLSYPFVYTTPENINTSNGFINALVVMSSNRSPEQVKACLNTIEVALGRDRTDPARSIKDRPADIDILGFTKTYEKNYFHTFNEAYIHAVLRAKNPAHLNGISLALHKQLSTTQGPTAIDLDTATGEIRIVENAIDGLEYR